MENLYLCNDFLSKESFESIWEDILKRTDNIKNNSLEELLQGFISEEQLGYLCKKGKLQHCAFYCGDYEDDKCIDTFYEYLKNQKNDEIESLEYGPSYISPKIYGTPGWWISINTKYGRNIELFSCKSFSAWKYKAVEIKSKLMSHIALEVQSLDDFDAISRYILEDPNITKIMYTENDSVGHTYAHFRKESTYQVVELLYINK